MGVFLPGAREPPPEVPDEGMGGTGEGLQSQWRPLDGEASHTGSKVMTQRQASLAADMQSFRYTFNAESQGHLDTALCHKPLPITSIIL